MITDEGRRRLANRIMSGGVYPGAMGIGDGSGAVAITNIDLINETSRKTFTSINGSNAQEVEFIADWNSVELSGANLTEFGIYPSGALGVGSLWSREAFNAINFDGSVELQIQVVYKVI